MELIGAFLALIAYGAIFAPVWLALAVSLAIYSKLPKASDDPAIRRQDEWSSN